MTLVLQFAPFQCGRAKSYYGVYTHTVEVLNGIHNFQLCGYNCGYSQVAQNIASFTVSPTVQWEIFGRCKISRFSKAGRAVTRKLKPGETPMHWYFKCKAIGGCQ